MGVSFEECNKSFVIVLEITVLNAHSHYHFKFIYVKFIHLNPNCGFRAISAKQQVNDNRDFISKIVFRLSMHGKKIRITAIDPSQEVGY